MSAGTLAAAWAGARRVQAGGWPMRYREAGSGPPVVLVHGLGLSADYWHRTALPLAAAGYRVLAPDLPGFGRTPGPRRALSIEAQASALAAWADALGLGRAAYMGHSLSCEAVAELAARAPQRVGALVLAAPTGGRRSGDRVRQLFGLMLDGLQEPLHLYPFVAQAYLRAGPHRVLATWAEAARHDTMARLREVSAPVLLVVGTRDPVVPRALAEEMEAQLERGRLLWIRGGTHAVLYSRPAEFNRAVLRFLNAECGMRNAE